MAFFLERGGRVDYATGLSRLIDWCFLFLPTMCYLTTANGFVRVHVYLSGFVCRDFLFVLYWKCMSVMSDIRCTGRDLERVPVGAVLQYHQKVQKLNFLCCNGYVAD